MLRNLEEFLRIIQKYHRALDYWFILNIKLILFIYIIIAFHTGVKDIEVLISLLISAGLILIPTKIIRK